MIAPKYSMSFTTGALLRRESVIVAELYRQLGDWDAVRKRVIAENRLQMRTLNSSRRVCREVVSRLRQLSPDGLEIVVAGARQEQGYALWLAVCRRYRFIYDFAVEVVREKYLRFELDLAYADYDAYFLDKAEWHPEVDQVAAATRSKQRQILFKMMCEADLLSPDGQILPALLTPRLVNVIRCAGPADFSVFPVSEADVKGWLA